jgi:hypothetical protein
MCYKVVNVDFTQVNESGDPLVRQLFDIEFPSQVLAELMVEKMYVDVAKGSNIGEFFEFPVGLINVHDGEITVFSDQDVPEGAGWDIDERFRLAKVKADHVVLRAGSATDLMEKGIAPDALWEALADFLIVNHPEVLGMDSKAPERLEALSKLERSRGKINTVASELAEKFGEPGDLSPEEMLKAIEYAIEQLQGPDGVDPQDKPDDADSTPPAPKGLKVRGED